MNETKAPRPRAARKKDVHLADYLDILLQHWKAAALTFALVFAATLLYLLFSTPVYEAYATLQVRKAAQGGMLKELGLEADGSLTTEIEVLQSRSLAEQVARRLAPASAAGLPPDPALVGAVQRSIRVAELGRGSNMLRVASRHSDPERARDVVNLLIDSYLESTAAVKAREAGRTVDFIARQLDGLKVSLDKAEQELQEYKVRTGLTTLGPEGGSLVGRVVGLEQQKTELSLKRQRVEYAIGALREAIGAGLPFTPPVIEGAPRIADGAARLAELEAARKGLLVNYTPRHPAVLEKEADIRRVQEAMLSAYETLRHELSLGERDAARTIAGFDAQLREVPETERELAKRTRVHKVNAELYNFLLQKQQEAEIAQASAAGGAEIIDPAIAPEEPIQPNRGRTLTLGLFLSLMLGGGAAFLLNYMDRTVRTSDDVRDKLGLPVLGTIPRIPPTDAADGTQTRLVTALPPRSPVAEAFRALRTNISFLTARESHKIILITSSFPSEGKSTISGNLAAILAQTGARVLLVGCDMRRPALYDLFNQSFTPGLSDLLIGEEPEAIRRLDDPGIDFLPSGTIPPNPAELLDSERMRRMLDDFRQSYDYVVLDAPPVLAVTDAQLLGPLADIVLVVIEPYRIPEQAALEMIEALEAVRVKISGAVLNDKTGRGFRSYGGYGYYGHRYFRGYYGENDEAARDQPSATANRGVGERPAPDASLPREIQPPSTGSKPVPSVTITPLRLPRKLLPDQRSS